MCECAHINTPAQRPEFRAQRNWLAAQSSLLVQGASENGKKKKKLIVKPLNLKHFLTVLPKLKNDHTLTHILCPCKAI